MEHRVLDKREALSAFGPVWDSAGIRGFSGEGYWFHRIGIPGLDFSGSTFVTKTVTTYRNIGNTPLTRSYEPRQLFPRSIVPYLFKGMVLNAVGLSNPGFEAFLTTDHWFSITAPFFISYMPVLSDIDIEAELETELFVSLLRQALVAKRFQASRIAIQLNLSCPNVGADFGWLLQKAHALLDTLSSLRLPVVVKLNLLAEPHTARQIARHPACTGICISDSLPFGELLPPSWWSWEFPRESPLARRGFGRGGLSGAPLLHLVRRWVEEFRADNTETYLNVGGGILHADDVDLMFEAGADSIFIGSVAMLRPWRVRGIINRAHQLY
jgi:dihydroorotate dehydrogenase